MAEIVLAKWLEDIDFELLYAEFKKWIKGDKWVDDNFGSFLTLAKGINHDQLYLSVDLVLQIYCDLGFIKHTGSVGPPECPDMFAEFEFLR